MDQVDKEALVLEFPKPREIFDAILSKQVKISTAKILELKRIRLEKDGSRALTDVWVDNLVIPEVLFTRNGESDIEVYLPTISYSFVTDERYRFTPELQQELKLLAEKILPPMLPYGWDPEGQQWVHAGTAMSDRIALEDLEDCKRRVESERIAVILDPAKPL